MGGTEDTSLQIKGLPESPCCWREKETPKHREVDLDVISESNQTRLRDKEGKKKERKER